MPDVPGTLWVVATPLGNPGDLSPRAREVLAGAGMILCEDTRRAARLFAAQGLPPGRFTSLFDHNESGRIPQVLDFLATGGQAAVISDAGTPLVSDPGYLLVRACRQAGFPVRPVPGPSAVMAALMAGGLPAHPFAFLGFLPRKPGQVRKAFERFADAACTLVFFERKDRLGASLTLALEVLGDRPVAVARELTKIHEEFRTGLLSELAERELDLLGEVTVVLGPPVEEAVSPGDEADRILAEERRIGGRPKEIARRAAARLPGWTAKALYERLTAAGDGEGG